MKPDAFRDQVVIVTGASAGIGKALAQQLASQGARVTIAARRAERLEQIAADCHALGGEVVHAAQMNKDGVPRGVEHGQDMYTNRMMSHERCAEITLAAAYNRRREVLMGPGPLAVWLKLLAPGFLDWAMVKFFLEPAIRRAGAGTIDAK